MTFTSIDDAMRECRKRRGYRVNFLMQVAPSEWRFSLKVGDAGYVWRDGASALIAINNVFAFLDDVPAQPAEDWV